MDKLRIFIGSLIHTASKKLNLWIEQVKMTEHLFMMILASIIGLLAGFGAVGIKELIHFISHISWSGEGSLLENIAATPWYWKILVPTIGGILVGPVIHFFAPEAKGHGVPEVMQAVITKGGKIRPRVALVKAFASSITIGTGGSVGKEGPIVQIGSSIGSTVGQFFQVSKRRMKTLVGCGAAAGIAAAFNAPVAGALFAVEIVLMDFKLNSLSPIVIASVLATVVSHSFEGDFAAFQVPHYQLVSSYEVVFYAILGVLSGLISFIFIKVLYFSEDFWDEKIKIPGYYKPAIGGILIGAMAIIVPQVMGVGYDSIDTALNSDSIWYLALILIFAKILATSLTLGSGGSGGIFAPSLFMGAMLGAFFGYFVHLLLPDTTAQPGAYALVAMGGLVAGTTRGPLAAILIVFELTKETSIILPLMITVTISMLISGKLSRESIYTLKLLLRKININKVDERDILENITVNDVFKSEIETIYEDTQFQDVVNKILSKKIPYLIVLKKNDDFMGIISINQIKELLFDKDILNNVLIAGDIADKNITKVKLGDNCKTVLEKSLQSSYDGLPVVEHENKIVGFVWRRDINEKYQKEMRNQQISASFADSLSKSNIDKEIQFMPGHIIAEIDVPEIFTNKSIKDLNIRSKYGVDVLSIKKITATGNIIKAIPDASYVISADDRLIVAGEIEKINLLKDLTD
jgi:CIC family chloride channel protein